MPVINEDFNFPTAQQLRERMDYKNVKDSLKYLAELMDAAADKGEDSITVYADHQGQNVLSHIFDRGNPQSWPSSFKTLKGKLQQAGYKITLGEVMRSTTSVTQSFDKDSVQAKMVPYIKISW